MNLISAQIHQVTDECSNNTEPNWMPDSQMLIYTSDQAGCSQIYKININGGVLEHISWEGKHNQDANISPDGEFMVMVNLSNNGYRTACC